MEGRKEGRKWDEGSKKVRKERKWKEEKEGSFIALLSILLNVDSFAVSVHQEKTANVLVASNSRVFSLLFFCLLSLFFPLPLSLLFSDSQEKNVNEIHVHAPPQY